MRTYIIRRVLLLIPTFFLLTLLVFLSVRFLPGDVVDSMMARVAEDQGGRRISTASGSSACSGWMCRRRCSTRAGSAASSCAAPLGDSLFGGATVEAKIIGRLAITVELGVLSILIGLVIAVPVGIYSAVRQDTASDYAGRSIAIIGLATPNFWLATLVLTFPAIWWAWAPPLRMVAFADDPLRNLGHLFIPSLILGTYLSATVMRMTRTMMLEVLRQDFIRTAWAKGLRERVIILRHVIKNALIPVVTLIGMQLPILVGGSVIMENMFAMPGLGRLMLEALTVRDYPVVSGINLFFATAVMTINLLIDILYGYLDPRVKYR